MNYLALAKAVGLTVLIVGGLLGLVFLALAFPQGAVVVGRFLVIGFGIGAAVMIAMALYEEFK